MTAESDRKGLRNFMRDRDLNPNSWAAKTKGPGGQPGVREGTIRAFLDGTTTSMKLATLERLAATEGVSVDEMFGRKARPAAKPASNDVVAIKRLKVKASMGGGYALDDRGEIEPIYFRKDWIEGLLEGEAAQLRAIDLAGDSMLPTIHDGDIGLAQLQAPFESGRCYVLWDGRGLVVKRLEGSLSDPEKLRVVSDNMALHPPYEVHAGEVHIIGRIVWRGGKI